MEKDLFEALAHALRAVGSFLRVIVGEIASRAGALAAIAAVGLLVLLVRHLLERRRAAELPTRLLVPGWTPPRLPVEGIRRLVLVHGHGRKSAQDALALTLFEQAGTRGVFDVDDWREQGARIVAGGERAEVDAAGMERRPGDAYLQLDIVEWRIEQDLLGEARVTRATVLLAATIVDDEGRTVVREGEYERQFTAQAGVDKAELSQRAASMAVGQLIDDLTPRLVDTPVELDLSDPGQLPALNAARRGDLKGALADLAAYVAENPENAAANYNLGVIYDALGEHAKAVDAHAEALRIGPKPFYRRAALAGGEKKRDLMRAARDMQRQRRIDGVLSAISAAKHRNELLDVLLRFAASRLETAAVFIVQPKKGRRCFVGWDIAHEHLTRADVRETIIPTDEEGGLLAKVYELRSPFLGPLAEDDPLVELLGQRPASCLAMPIMVGGHIAGVIYGDSGGKPVPQSVFVELQTVLPAAGEGLRDIIVVSQRGAAVRA